MSNESVDDKIISRAMKDPEFRKRLLANPADTLSKDFGVTIPAGVKMQVHEEGDTVRHLVLPKVPSKPSKELSDAQLEAAAGGLRRQGGCCCTCGSSTHQSIWNSNGP